MNTGWDVGVKVMLLTGKNQSCFFRWQMFLVAVLLLSACVTDGNTQTIQFSSIPATILSSTQKIMTSVHTLANQQAAIEKFSSFLTKVCYIYYFLSL
jgi:uncharacterized lipoprotein YajG